MVPGQRHAEESTPMRVIARIVSTVVTPKTGKTTIGV